MSKVSKLSKVSTESMEGAIDAQMEANLGPFRTAVELITSYGEHRCADLLAMGLDISVPDEAVSLPAVPANTAVIADRKCLKIKVIVSLKDRLAVNLRR